MAKKIDPKDRIRRSFPSTPSDPQTPNQRSFRWITIAIIFGAIVVIIGLVYITRNDPQILNLDLSIADVIYWSLYTILTILMLYRVVHFSLTAQNDTIGSILRQIIFYLGYGSAIPTITVVFLVMRDEDRFEWFLNHFCLPIVQMFFTHLRGGQ